MLVRQSVVIAFFTVCTDAAESTLTKQVCRQHKAAASSFRHTAHLM